MTPMRGGPLPASADVVVVGAGPTGLALACSLRAADVDVLVIDRAAEGANTSRAAVIHARTLEVLAGLGVTARLVGEGLVASRFSVRDRGRLLAQVSLAGLPTPYPYALLLPQSRTEAILTQRLTELGGSVHRPWEATTVSTVSDGAVVLASSGERSTEVRARYVVGADGMHSVVRGSAGIGFTGGRYNASFVLADVQMDWPLPAGELQLFLSPTGVAVVVPLPGGRHRVVATMDPAPETADVALVQTLLEERGPGGARVHDIAWASRFRVHHRVADAYRRGPLLLAGDAAHVHSPAGGQGMNTGIQDAVDLGHTLAAILQGRSHDTALQGYEQRRRPVAQQVIALTDRATRAATLTNPAARAVRNTAITVAGRIPAARRRIAMQIAELSAPRYL